MDGLLIKNILTLLPNIWGSVLKMNHKISKKQLSLKIIRHQKIFLKINMHLFRLFGMNLKFTSINMIKEAKDILNHINLKLSSLKFYKKTLKDNLTMLCGTYSELILMEMQPLNSMNLHHSF